MTLFSALSMTRFSYLVDIILTGSVSEPLLTHLLTYLTNSYPSRYGEKVSLGISVLVSYALS